MCDLSTSATAVIKPQIAFLSCLLQVANAVHGLALITKQRGAKHNAQVGRSHLVFIGVVCNPAPSSPEIIPGEGVREVKERGGGLGFV